MPLIHDVDLAKVAQASAERLRLFADRQGVDLSVEIDGIPPVRGDEDRLGQVLVNLHPQRDQVQPRGRPGARRRAPRRRRGRRLGRWTRASASRVAAQPRVFERFYKVDRARVRGGGTGLGLAISRHVVEAHGGRIWVESDEGRGSTFSFAIPAAAAAA